MTWSTAAGSQTLYESQGAVDSETIFDAGETRWDLDLAGNVPRTRFDAVLSTTPWSAQDAAQTAWSPA